MNFIREALDGLRVRILNIGDRAWFYSLLNAAMQCIGQTMILSMCLSVMLSRLWVVYWPV